MSAYIPKIEYGGFVPTVVNLTYPPSGYGEPEQLDAKERVNVSLSGSRQVQVDFVEARRELNFRMLTEDQVAALEAFFLDWASLGKAFKYFDDKNSVDFLSYELADFKFMPKRIAIAGDNAFFYEVRFTFRRVVGVTDAGGYLEQEILNNQVTPVDIDTLLLDEAEFRSAKVFFEVVRKTDSNEAVANGWLTAVYRESLASWDITPDGNFEGDAHGLTFSISAAGQVKYVSDNMAGTNYEGVIRLRNFTIIGG